MRPIDLVIPPDIPLDRMPALLGNWYLGSRARRHLSARRFEAVVELAVRRGGRGRALDVGCGWGYGLYLLQNSGFAAYGIDIVDNDFFAARKVAAANGYRSELACADVSRLPFSGALFDAVTSVETFEHVFEPDRRRAFLEIARVLVPGGLFALSTPNYRSIVESGKRQIVRVPALKRLFPAMCYPAGHVAREEYHPYRYHRPLAASDLRAMFEEAGFDILSTNTMLFMWKNVPDRLFPLLRAVEWVLERCPLIRRLGSTLVCLARKR